MLSDHIEDIYSNSSRNKYNLNCASRTTPCDFLSISLDDLLDLSPISILGIPRC